MAQEWSVGDELLKLANLKEKGLLSDDEFQAQKEKLLGPQVTDATSPVSTGFRVGDLANVEISKRDQKTLKWFALAEYLRHLADVAKGTR